MSLSLLSAGCGEDPLDVPPGQIDVCGYRTAEDLNPDPSIVEVELVASEVAWDPGNGIPIRGLGYNGMVPGPLIQADVGDTIVVHFTNRLDVETTIHWHGIRLSNEMDGTHIVHDPVQPGGSFEYRFTVPDAGTYWYHPHMDAATQTESGLQAPLVVRDPSEPRVSCDQTLVLDDVLLDGQGQLEPPGQDAMMEMERLGNLLLVNGVANKRLAVAPGGWQLWRLVSSANTRYFDLQVEGHQLTVVGTDGGYIDAAYAVDHLLLAPGERYMVLVQATGTPGKSYAVKTLPFDLHESGGMMGGMSHDPLPQEPLTLWTLDYAETPAASTDAPVIPPAGVPAWTAGEEIAHHWVFDQEGHTYTIDGETWPDVPMLSFAADQMYSFEIENRSTMHHPLHIHGQRFQVVARDGQAVVEPAWKDTVNIPPGSTLSIVSLLDNPGHWLYHCHILEHEEGGMMGELEVMGE